MRRSRLLEDLEEAFAAGQGLVLLEAPAGYGKTTLLANWLSGCGRPFAWFSLDEGDNDPARFLAGFIAALRTAAGEGMGQAAESMLRMPQPPSLEVAVAYLINDLADLKHPLVLVLDDYHVITTEAVHRAVQVLLEHRPGARRVVLATRAAPPLSVARLRARGEVLELRWRPGPKAGQRGCNWPASPCKAEMLTPFGICDAVTGSTDSKAVIALLEQSDLFLVPLDDRREWYRYHHLFRDVLQTELPP